MKVAFTKKKQYDQCSKGQGILVKLWEPYCHDQTAIQLRMSSLLEIQHNV
jgi:hypothetical protein